MQGVEHTGEVGRGVGVTVTIGLTTVTNPVDGLIAMCITDSLAQIAKCKEDAGVTSCGQVCGSSNLPGEIPVPTPGPLSR
jgi:hypothetical protein